MVITIASLPKQTWQHYMTTCDNHIIYIPPRRTWWRQVPLNASNPSTTVFLCQEKWMGGKKNHQVTSIMLSPFSVWGSAITYWFDIWVCQVHGRARISWVQRDKLACVTLRMARYHLWQGINVWLLCTHRCRCADLFLLPSGYAISLALCSQMKGK